MKWALKSKELAPAHLRAELGQGSLPQGASRLAHWDPVKMARVGEVPGETNEKMGTGRGIGTYFAKSMPVLGSVFFVIFFDSLFPARFPWIVIS